MWENLTFIACLLATSQVGTNGDAVQPLAILDGESITESAIAVRVSGQIAKLRAQEYEIKRQALDEFIATKLMQSEARKLGISLERLLQVNVENRVPPINESDLENAYESLRGSLKQRPKEEALKELQRAMRNGRLKARTDEYVQELLSHANIQIRMQPPRIAVDVGSALAVGPAEAPVTIVEFTDFQCPFCARIYPLLRDVQARYAPMVRIVFRHYPLTESHPNAQKAAESIECAAQQGALLKMQERLFVNQSALDIADLKHHASALGLDENRFDRCIDSGEFSARVTADRDLGMRVGVDGTPVVFVNGRRVFNVTPAVLDRVLKDELANAATRPLISAASR